MAKSEKGFVKSALTAPPGRAGSVSFAALDDAQETAHKPGSPNRIHQPATSNQQLLYWLPVTSYQLLATAEVLLFLTIYVGVLAMSKVKTTPTTTFTGYQ